MSIDSSSDTRESCPRVYEEIIQQLEADIRKHIRIEHQLKLHIESVEDRVEELERDLDKTKLQASSTRASHRDEDRSMRKREEANKKEREDLLRQVRAHEKTMVQQDKILEAKEVQIKQLVSHNEMAVEERRKAEVSNHQMREQLEDLKAVVGNLKSQMKLILENQHSMRG
mmetsp:Transcript_21574/g.33222  ORF Transcript_21574/g.33222 Transcript_21574/m.33222 type:complete len:171 (+) Transcript_21574:42-554(+)